MLGGVEEATHDVRPAPLPFDGAMALDWYLQGMSEEELAERFGLSVRTLRKRLAWAAEQASDYASSLEDAVLPSSLDAGARRRRRLFYGLGVMKGYEESRAEETKALDGLPRRILWRCMANGIRTPMALYGWVVSGKMLEERGLGVKAVEEAKVWLGDRGFRFADDATARKEEGARLQALREVARLLVQAAGTVVLANNLERRFAVNPTKGLQAKPNTEIELAIVDRR